MIDEATKPLYKQIAELEDALKDAFRPGDLIALQSNNGMFMCAEQGGPGLNGRYVFTGKAGVSVWESYTIVQGAK